MITLFTESANESRAAEQQHRDQQLQKLSQQIEILQKGQAESAEVLKNVTSGTPIYAFFCDFQFD